MFSDPVFAAVFAVFAFLFSKRRFEQTPTRGVVRIVRRQRPDAMLATPITGVLALLSSYLPLTRPIANVLAGKI